MLSFSLRSTLKVASCTSDPFYLSLCESHSTQYKLLNYWGPASEEMALRKLSNLALRNYSVFERIQFLSFENAWREFEQFQSSWSIFSHFFQALIFCFFFIKKKEEPELVNEFEHSVLQFYFEDSVQTKLRMVSRNDIEY